MTKRKKRKKKWKWKWRWIRTSISNPSERETNIARARQHPKHNDSLDDDQLEKISADMEANLAIQPRRRPSGTSIAVAPQAEEKQSSSKPKVRTHCQSVQQPPGNARRRLRPCCPLPSSVRNNPEFWNTSLPPALERRRDMLIESWEDADEAERTLLIEQIQDLLELIHCAPSEEEAAAIAAEDSSGSEPESESESEQPISGTGDGIRKCGQAAATLPDSTIERRSPTGHGCEEQSTASTDDNPPNAGDV